MSQWELREPVGASVGSRQSPRGSKRLAGEFLHKQSRLIAVAFEGVDGSAHILVPLALVEAERVRVTGPGGEPEKIGAFRAGQGLGSDEQLRAEALP